MKTISILLCSTIISLSIVAQTVTISFVGTNKNRNYQVVLDGTSYYSDNKGSAVQKSISLSNMPLGSHKIEVYRAGTYNDVSKIGSSEPTGSAIYSNTFQLRDGYDMNIQVRGNG